MRDESTEAFATRLSPELAAVVHAALDETGVTRADFLRLAISYYVQQNPHRFEALGSTDWFDQMLRQMERSRD